MFSIKNWFLKSVSKNSDSFEERFCDDLCEEILQYLPLKDKLRLECVSKQFQRTVFQKQVSLTLHEEKSVNHNLKMEISTKERYMKSIESLLKKCPNIRRIDSRFLENYQKHKNTIHLITKYCNHLIEFHFSFIDSNEREFKEFHQKFGSKLKKLDGIFYSIKLKLFPNLDTLDTNCFPSKFPKIRHLNLHFKTNNGNSVFNAFQGSTVLQNLIELNMWTNGDQRAVFVVNCLKQMAINFPNLKRIVFSADMVLENISDIEQLMSSLKAFPHLKRLDFRLKFMTFLKFDAIFSLKSFPEQLTHLGLFFRIPYKLKVSHLKDLEIHLPKLQYLFIKNQIIADEEGVTQMAEILSRLPRLESINLEFDSEVNCQPIREKIIEKCLKIRSIVINDKLFV